MCLRLLHIFQILKNLENGLSEDGSPAELNAADAAESKRLWCNREIRTLHSIVNCAISNKVGNRLIVLTMLFWHNYYLEFSLSCLPELQFSPGSSSTNSPQVS